MSDNTKNDTKTNSRRQVLKATLAGTGAVIAGKSLPEQWSRPVVDSITLPAHAQTSLVSVSGGILMTAQEVDASDWLNDHLVPTAMAGGGMFPPPEPSVIIGQMCVQGNADGTVNAQVLVRYTSWNIDYPYFTGTNIPVNTPTELTLQNGPCSADSTYTCTITVVPSGGAATGTLSIYEAVTGNPDTSAQTSFNLADPGCSITNIPGCDD